MGYANKLSLALLVGLSVAASTSVASAQNMSRRDAAIRKCIQQAHAQYPRYYAGVGTDRTYVYKACMTNIGTAPVGCRGSVDVNCLEASAQLRVNEYTPFCNGPGDVKSPRVIVTPPSSRFCPWLALRPPHYAVRGTVSLSRYAWFIG